MPSHTKSERAKKARAGKKKSSGHRSGHAPKKSTRRKK